MDHRHHLEDSLLLGYIRVYIFQRPTSIEKNSEDFELLSDSVVKSERFFRNNNLQNKTLVDSIYEKRN